MNEINREVPLREPLDMDKLCNQVEEEINALGKTVIPSQQQAEHIATIVLAGTCLANAITQALPEGNERIIALNNIKSTIMWAKHGILSRSVEVHQA